MSKRQERKARQANAKAVQRQEAVKLSPEQLQAAAQCLVAWLNFWSVRNWGLMATVTQCPLLGKAKAEHIAAQFASNLLVNWEPDIIATKAMADEVDGETIGYVDFAVRVLISNNVTLGRFGIFARCVLRGATWMVNPRSINRRFDPKLADLALKDMEDVTDGSRDEDKDDVGQATAPTVEPQ